MNLEKQWQKLRFNSELPFTYKSSTQLWECYSPKTEECPFENTGKVFTHNVLDLKTGAQMQLSVTKSAQEALMTIIEMWEREVIRTESVRRFKMRRSIFQLKPVKRSNLSGKLRTSKPDLHKQKTLVKRRSNSHFFGTKSQIGWNLEVNEWPKL